jgi:cell division protein FtsN
MEYHFDRLHMIWLSLGGVIAMALMFALGLVVGKRSARIELDGAPAKDPIAQLDVDGDMHKQLTFYERLTAKDAGSAPPPAPAPVPRVAAEAPEQGDDSDTPAGPPAASGEDQVTTALASGPAHSGDFTVQVSAFQSYDEAKAYSAQLERKGFKPFIVAAEIKGKGTWYRVRIGSFRDEQLASSAKGVLARADIPAWVLKAE